VNAIELLKEDHEVVSKLFDQVRSTPESKHRALFNKIKAELDTHAHIEETVFYPRLKKDGKKDLVDVTLEGIEEHRQVKMFLEEMAGMRRGGDEFEAKLKVLMEDVEHHVEEEEGAMFPMVKDQFSDAVLERLGKSLENKKIKFLEKKPEVAKNLANRASMRKSGVLGAMYKAATAAVGELLSGPGLAKKPGSGRSAKSSNGRSTNGRAKTSNGKTAAKTGGARKATTKKTSGSGARSRSSASK
jgi:hemerythrin superfamily protein